MLNFESNWPSLSASLTVPELADLYSSVHHLETFYPQFESWFWAKVMPGCRDQTRRIIQVRAGAQLAGLAILKRTPTERKICTLWVAPYARGRGFGHQLVVDSLTWLDCERPLITVCQERLHELQPLLTKFGFKFEQAVNALYRPKRLEYVFNGIVAEPQAILHHCDLPALHLEEGPASPLCVTEGCLDLYRL